MNEDVSLSFVAVCFMDAHQIDVHVNTSLLNVCALNKPPLPTSPWRGLFRKYVYKRVVLWRALPLGLNTDICPSEKLAN